MHNPTSTASTAQIEANRRNAKHGRGPNTAHGKVRSSGNSIRHGLTGRIVVLPTEDMAAYKVFSKELVDSLDAQTPMERQLAQTIADSQWRLNRARTFEDGMLALGDFEGDGSFHALSPEMNSALTVAKVFRDRSKDFVNLSLYEQRIQRAQKNAFDQLRQLQTERKAAPAPVDTPRPVASVAVSAIANTRARTMSAGRGTTPIPASASEEIGFVYSGAEIDIEPRHPAQHPIELPVTQAA